MKHATTTAIVFGVLLTVPALAEEKRSADAHEHGHGSFNMAIEGKTAEIELEASSFDILGFEHTASSEAEHAAIHEAREILADPVALFGLPKSAKCSLADVDIDIGADPEHHGEHGDEHDSRDHEEGGEHSDVHAHYALACNAPGKLTTVNMSAYFKAFSNAKELDAAILSDTGQAAGELEANSPELSF